MNSNLLIETQGLSQGWPSAIFIANFEHIQQLNVLSLNLYLSDGETHFFLCLFQRLPLVGILRRNIHWNTPVIKTATASVFS